MSRYIGTTDLRAYLSPDNALPTTQNGLLQDCIDRAESAINDYTRRNFVGTAGTAYINRFSAGQVSGQALYLTQDLYALDGVLNGDGRVITSGSVWLEPRNVGPPYRVVRLKSQFVWIWNTDSDLIVSGTFGFSLVAPDAIKQATIRYAAHLFKQKDVGPSDVAGFPEAGEVSYPKGMPDDVRYLLAPYRSRSGGVI